VKAADQLPAIVVVEQARQSLDLLVAVVALQIEAEDAGEDELADELRAIARHAARTPSSRGAS